jgi:lysyl endopeptidase
MNRGICIILGLFILFANLFSQTSFVGGIPNGLLDKSLNEAPVIEMPGLDTSAIISEKSTSNSDKFKKYTIGKNFNVEINPESSGLWQVLKNKNSLWSVKIRSHSALAIGMVLNNYSLKPGERLFVYNENEIIGALSSENNLPSHILPVQPIKGDQITIEFETPFKNGYKGSFTIETVAHIYENLWQEPGGCNININCEEGKAWQTEKRAVLRMIIYSNGTILGTGTLINNTLYDSKPYVLAANHVLFDNYEADRTLFYFNYESPECAGTTGNSSMVLSGAKVVATYYDYDFTLLELYNHPPEIFKPYYAGWSTNTGDNLDTVVSIHHPWAGVKKICISNNRPIIATFKADAGDPPYAENGFWLVAKWDRGVTERGSSGAALFDRDHRIVGSLTGGDAVCGSPINDNFARFDFGFDNNPDTNKQLQYWLDPLHSGATFLDGYNPFLHEYTGCDTISNIDTSEHTRVLPYELGKGYFSGTNSDSIEQYAEKFLIKDSLVLTGVIFNINVKGKTGGIVIQVFSGINVPEKLVKESYVSFDHIKNKSLNYFEFYPNVVVKNRYFIGYKIAYNGTDTFNMFQAAPRYAPVINTAYLNYKGSWFALNQLALTGWGSSFDIRPVTCQTPVNTSILENSTFNLFIYPNPAREFFTLKIPSDVHTIRSIEACDLSGRMIGIRYNKLHESAVCNISNLTPGIYMIKVSTNKGIYHSKFIKER